MKAALGKAHGGGIIHGVVLSDAAVENLGCTGGDTSRIAIGPRRSVLRNSHTPRWLEHIVGHMAGGTSIAFVTTLLSEKNYLRLTQVLH